MNHFEKACEGVDAAIFSGDTLWDDNKRQMLKDYLARWSRAVEEHEQYGDAKPAQGGELPELPRAVAFVDSLETGEKGWLNAMAWEFEEMRKPLYTAEQMGAYARAALAQAPAAEPAPAAWVPYLSDRADGVQGHYAIARHHPSGYREVWNLRKHCWSSFSDDVLTLEQAQSLLQQIVIPTPTHP